MNIAKQIRKSSSLKSLASAQTLAFNFKGASGRTRNRWRKFAADAKKIIKAKNEKKNASKKARAKVPAGWDKVTA